MPVDEGGAPAIEADSALPLETNQMLRSLERAFAHSFAMIECGTGRVLRAAASGLSIDLYTRLASCTEIAERGQPEILDEVSPLLLLAVPLPAANAGCTM